MKKLILTTSLAFVSLMSPLALQSVQADNIQSYAIQAKWPEFEKAVRETTEKKLNFADSPRLKNGGVGALMRGLLGNEHVIDVNITDNQIIPEDLPHLIKYLESGGPLQVLLMGGTKISDENLIKISKALPKSRNLKIINMMASDFGEDASIAFFQALPSLKSLELVNFTVDKLSLKLAQAIADVISSSGHFGKLQLLAMSKEEGAAKVIEDAARLKKVGVSIF